MIKKAFVIGSNTSKSLSPYIFKYWFDKYNINGDYFFVECKPENFIKTLSETLKDRAICGYNVTIPFKEDVDIFVDRLDREAVEIGATNCVSKTTRGWQGKNTDWVGFIKSLEFFEKKIEKNKALVLGYGGASKAICFGLQKFGFKEIVIYNRTKEKTKDVIKKPGYSVIGSEKIPESLNTSDIVINTTPVDPIHTIAIHNVVPDIFSCDIVYRPKETKFLSHFKKNKRLYGINMLIHQAAPCFENWFGVCPNVDENLVCLLDSVLGK